tara:strand:- start:50160 stop:50507 length:348 start_codon:yes stop_codon:yes gene_type:complete
MEVGVMFNNKVFDDCEFIIGHDNSMVVIVPQSVPKGEALNLHIAGDVVSFYKEDGALFGRINCTCPKTLRCLRKKKRIGLIESLGGAIKFPTYISAIANVDVDALAYNGYTKNAA